MRIEVLSFKASAHTGIRRGGLAGYRPKGSSLTCAELYSVVQGVHLARGGRGSLEHLSGGPKAQFYRAAEEGPPRVLAMGNEWVNEGGGDRLQPAYRALRRLRAVDSVLAPKLGRFFRVQNPDSTTISVFEAEYIEPKGKFFLAPRPLDKVLTYKYDYSQEAVGAFLDFLFLLYERLGGLLPAFSLKKHDVLGIAADTGATQKFQRQPHPPFGDWYPVEIPVYTYQFIFLWCDDLVGVERPQLLEFLIDQIVPYDLFRGELFHEERAFAREPIVELVERKVEEYLGSE